MTYVYVAEAYDGKGNRSEASNPVSVTIEGK